jgi:excisionase family DNA binding protein
MDENMDTIKTIEIDEAFTLDQTAARLQCTRDTARKLIKAGKLRATKIGSRYRVAGSAINEFLQGSR